MKIGLSTQFIGGAILLFAFVMALMGKTKEAATALIFVAVTDVYLIYIAKEKSISYWIRSLTPRYVDYCLMVGLLVLVFHICSLNVTVWFVLGILCNHLFEIQNRS